MAKKRVTVEYSQREIYDKAFRLNQSASTTRRIGEYIVNHDGDISGISKETFINWAKNLIDQSDKILEISENLWPKAVEGDDDYKQ